MVARLGKVGATLVALAVLALPTSVQARAVLYGSPGAEQELLQSWIDEAHARSPNVRVRLFERNCRSDAAPETLELPGQKAGVVQSCADFTSEGSEPSAKNEAIDFPHISWHPQYPMWWWHLNLLNELGHVYDAVVRDRDRHREAFAHIAGIFASWWWPVNTWAAIADLWEKWSMAYAFCGYGMSYEQAHALIESGRYAGFGFEPNRSEYDASCRLIEHLPGRTGRRVRLPRE